MSPPSLMTYKGYAAIISLDADDEIFVGRVLGINDVIGFHANSVKGLKAAFHEAIDDYLATCEKIGKQPEKRASGNLMLRVAPEVHAQATIAAEASGKSLNQWAEDLFRQATRMEHREQHLSAIYKTSFRVARRKKRNSPKAAQASRG